MSIQLSCSSPKAHRAQLEAQKESESSPGSPKAGRASKLFRKFFLGFAISAAAFGISGMQAGCRKGERAPSTQETKMTQEEFESAKLRIIQDIVWKCGKESDEALRKFDEILSSRNFQPEFIMTLEKYLRHGVRSKDGIGPSILSCLSSFRNLFLAKHFSPQTIDITDSMIKRDRHADYEALNALALMLGEKNFDPTILVIAKMIVDNNTDDLHSAFSSLNSMKEFHPEFISKIKTIEALVERAGAGADGALEAMVFHRHSSEAGVRMPEFDLSLAERIGDFFAYARQKGGNRYRRLHMVFADYFRNVNFRLEYLDKDLVDRMFDVAGIVVEKGKTDKGAQRLLFAIVRNPGFSPEVLDWRLAENLKSFAKAMPEKDRNLWNICFEVVSTASFRFDMLNGDLVQRIEQTLGFLRRSAGKDASLHIRMFEAFAGNPAFGLHMLEEKFVNEMCETVRYIKRASGSKFPDSELWLMFRSKKFRPGMFRVFRYLAEKHGHESHYALGTFKKVFDSRRFDDDVMNAAWVLMRAAGRRDVFAINPFYEILQSPHYDPAIPALIMKMSSKTNANAHLAAELLASVVTSPRFKPGMLNGFVADDLCWIINKVLSSKERQAKQSLFTIEKILNSTGPDARALSVIRISLERSGAHVPEVLSSLRKIMDNPHLDLNAIDGGYIMRLADISRQIRRAGISQESRKEMQESFESILKCRNFEPSALGFVHSIASGSGRNISHALELFLNMQKNRNFVPSTIRGDPGKALARTIIDVAKDKGHKSDYAELLDEMLTNQNLRPSDVMEPASIRRLKEFCHWLDEELRESDSVSYAKSILLRNLVKNPNFRLEHFDSSMASRLAEAALYLEKNSSDNGLVVATALSISKRYFRPQMLSVGFVKKIERFGESFERAAQSKTKHTRDFAYCLLMNESLDPQSIDAPLGRDAGLFAKLVAKDRSSDKTHESMLEPPSVILVHSKDFHKKLPEILARYADGKKLARSLGADHSDPVACINFAYSLATIGMERTKMLYTSAGIENFTRYSSHTLMKVYENMISGANAGKPLLLALFSKADSNGAFYREGQELEKLTRYYRLHISEVGSRNEFYLATRGIASRYGKPQTIMIGGHGDARGIKLGKKDDSESDLDLRDNDVVSAVRENFGENPTVILVSCSTGQNETAIGGVLARTWNARLYAPVFPSARTLYNLDPSGKIIGVTYDVAAKEFNNGKNEAGH